MCGIFAQIECQNSTPLDDVTLEKLFVLIDQRGPDYSSPICELNTRCKLKLKLKASILHLRGNLMQKQPVVDIETNDALLFNGQIYKFNNEALDPKLSDTSFLFGQLKLCETREEVAETFASIDGPFAFVYWNDKFNTLFYGRDLFGRKSLCILKESSNSIPQVIASVMYKTSRVANCDKQNLICTEVDCVGIYSVDFSSCDFNQQQLEQPKQTIYTWQLNKIYPVTSKCNVIKEEEFIEYRAIQTIPLKPLEHGLKLWQEFGDEEHQKAMQGFEEKLLSAIKRRVEYDRRDCLDCRKLFLNGKVLVKEACNHSKVAVAFSGGIDSTLIALLLDKVLDRTETIDLSTVAFKPDSPDRTSVGKAYKELIKLCPNRRWRLIICDVLKETLQEERENTIRHLIAPCNTVIDDSLGCGCWFIGRAKGRSIDSVMDKELFETTFDTFLNYKPAYELPAEDESIKLNYQSPAIMFFAGMSIDEQLGGYSSHRVAWSRVKAPGVLEEVSFQMRRLSSRNLGRDDRTFSHHGRDVKLPYLDQDLVSYINQLPIGLKMNLAEQQDMGPKKLLRQLAFKCGLEETSKRVKRALQFGTRIANLEDAKEQGNDVCTRL